MERKLALDIDAYSSGSRKTAMEALGHDVARLAIESGGGVNSVNWHLKPDGKVVQLSLDPKRDVKNFFSRDNLTEKAESDAGMKIRESLVNEPIGTMMVWLSPRGGPLNYERAGVQVGVIREIEQGVKFIEQYVMVDRENDREEYLRIGERLNVFSKTEYNLSEVEELRSQVFIIEPRNGDPWQWLSRLIPLEKSWQSIFNGEAHSLLIEVEKEVRGVLDIVKGEWERARVGTWQDKLRLGAKIESLMEERGRSLKGGDCGGTNSVELSSMLDGFWSTVFSSVIKINTDNNEPVNSGESSKFVKNCGKCGARINARISAGYICSNCGGVYGGC
ncbi:MAG: hypothetical protein U9Q63_02315 [Patescibacteria group bacterium]|nr:hypothetical protein [Patescibacteria group bacterium]